MRVKLATGSCTELLLHYIFAIIYPFREGRGQSARDLDDLYRSNCVGVCTP